ncbi:E3 ubiquitin-protein ligase rad18 [Aspergillus hancockii]|nr:E3 ubiquitin-protein ligase rad18 [Aspergillus hancockii]
MERTFNLPDSTDWLDTPLSLLTPLESALRCQVCKDFFDNPVITSCSHTFCSLCIRRCLSTEGKCPACRSSDQELKLRRNWAVQELVEAFQNARPRALELARRAADDDREETEQRTGRPVSKKRKVEERGGSNTETSEGRQTRSRTKGGEPQTETATMEVIEDSQDEEYVPGSEDGLVACPVCKRRMKNEAVFQHLDTCTGDPAPPKKILFGSLQQPMSRNQSPNKQPERLPTINYSLLKDSVLRKKLKDLGIPNWGPRPLLQKRHTEWMNLWNANCDSKTPKSKRELLSELDVWERTQGGHSTPSAESASSVMRKDFDAAAWSTNHESDFKQLIANARKRSDDLVRTTIPSAALPELQQTTPPNQSAGALVQTNVQKPAQPLVGLTGTDFSKPREAQSPGNSQGVNTLPG